MKTYDWHLLDGRAIWVKELAAALSQQVHLLTWVPDIHWFGMWKNAEYEESCSNPPLILRHFPLQRGFARLPLRWFSSEGQRIAKRCRGYCKNEATTVLCCASPHYAAVAWNWRGPVIYYMSDLYYAWGDNPAYINHYDRQMCSRADLVCPVSERGKAYLLDKAGCPLEKIMISPMATRQANLLHAPLLQPGPLPELIADLPRPIVGIIGNLARNTDWLFLEEAVQKLNAIAWVFVGPTDMEVPDVVHRHARTRLMQLGGKVRFVGSQPYGDLARFAQSFDVALLPYRKIEPTYSGSSTRFYEHLAACRPMFSTTGFAELLSKEPLVHIVQNAQEFITQFHQLAQQGFRDGHEMDRWQASRKETWEQRASDMIAAIRDRMKHEAAT
ncbi:MAG TPA: glycosyltransferase [Gemmatales bacterium]|nr:glycosyltransferase [Gemmatales bacterium]